MQDAMPAWPDEVSALQKILVTEKAPEDPQAWEKLLPYAREHNLLPLLRKKLGGSAAVPEPVRAIFQREYMRSAAAPHFCKETWRECWSSFAQRA